MQAKVLSLAVGLALLVAAPLAARDGNRGSRDPDHRPDRRQGVIIAPEIFIGRDREPKVDPVQATMAEIEACVGQGVRFFVDCLRRTHSSVEIRRLEACLRSETIPDDPTRVAVCVGAVTPR